MDIQLRMIREDLEAIKMHVTNQYHCWPCCPDCGDESCFKFAKCVNRGCAECAFAKSTGLATTCPDHAPELNMRINFTME